MSHDEGYDGDSPSSSGKKRVRATQACILCRKKKIKCDGTKPECLHCLEVNMMCEYTESRKRGPRKGYVQLLEERLAQLEDRLSDKNSDSKGRSKKHLKYSPQCMPPYYSDRTYEDNVLKKKDESLSKRVSQRHSSGHLNRNLDFYPPLDIIMHLMDLFFKHLNAVFPLVHRKTLKQSIQDGTVSRPLLWSIMAVGARFSDNPAIETDPPYWAGERFAIKATSMINAALLEPTIPNLQFWGIMSCLEYGRASGSRAWIYGGLAVRICQELGLNKEETLSVPIVRKDGSVDLAAMALRKRIFWSCYALDRFASAGTGRPQYFDANDCDASLPTVQEGILLLDMFQSRSITGDDITNDSLIDITRHYLQLVTLFGDANKFMTRAKAIRAKSGNTTWPPVEGFLELDRKLRKWKEDLPCRFKFSPENLAIHKQNASLNYLTTWLSSHAVWCTTMMVLHRCSLAYDDKHPVKATDSVYEPIKQSIDTCKSAIKEAMILFRALKSLCGPHVWPYMGYSAYVCATVLMTSTFSRNAECYKESREGLKMLYEVIDGLRPYWPMCERLALTTKDLLNTHSKMYSSEYAQELMTPSSSSSSESNTASNEQQQQQHNVMSVDSVELGYTSNLCPQSMFTSIFGALHPQQETPAPTPQQSALPLLVEAFNTNGTIDFNSSDFLYDSDIFGHIMFDTVNARPQDQQHSLPSMLFVPTTVADASSISMPTFLDDTTTSSSSHALEGLSLLPTWNSP